MNDPALSLGRLQDIPDTGLKAVEFQGRHILLVKSGQCITAIEGICPHAGGPLADGVLFRDRVICPWHKAAFSVKSGACLEPPAVDDLAAIPLEICGDDIYIAPATSTAAPLHKPKEPLDKRHFAIIGAGATGFSAAQMLRSEGFTGEIQLIDPSEELPYDRTILSKYVMAGTKAGEKTPLQDESFYQRHAIERRRAKVRVIDTATKQLSLDDGTTQQYDAILIATGSIVRPIPFPGAELEGVFTLRSARDAALIAEAAANARHAVIVGASFIGMEVAAGLRERGLDVTVIGEEKSPFEKQLGAEVGAIFRHMHEKKGVQFRLGSKILRLEGNKAVRAVRLASGEVICTELVVAGLGVSPATELISKNFKQDDGGIIVDANLQLTDGIYAGGDIAAFPLWGNDSRIRVEHWRVAEQHGRIAARNMLGQSVNYASVPYFWTIQYKKRLDYVGHASGGDEILIRGDLREENFIAYYMRNGIVAAAAGLNRDKEMAAIIELMEMRHDWRLDELHPAGSSPDEVLAKHGI